MVLGGFIYEDSRIGFGLGLFSGSGLVLAGVDSVPFQQVQARQGHAG